MRYDLGSRTPLEGRPHPGTVTKATIYGVEQVDEAGHRLLLASAELMDATIAGLLAELPDVAPPPGRTIRLGWRHTFRRLYHRSLKAIHDRLFRGFCDHDGCYY